MKQIFDYSFSYSDVNNRVKGITISTNNSSISDAIKKLGTMHKIREKDILGLVVKK